MRWGLRAVAVGAALAETMSDYQTGQRRVVQRLGADARKVMDVRGR